MAQTITKYKYPNSCLLPEINTTTATEYPDELYKQLIKQLLDINQIGYSLITSTVGPATILFEITLSMGTRIAKIKNLSDDFAALLKAKSFRMITPVPGRGTIGIEISHASTNIISLRSLITSHDFINCTKLLPVILGKSVNNEIYIANLAELPHLLIAGATGQGKSVGINAMLISLLFKKHPLQLKLVIIDPKRVEFSMFNKISNQFLGKLPNHSEAVITSTRDAIYALNALCIEMDNRYELLKNTDCRNTLEYNSKFHIESTTAKNGHTYLPCLVLVIDEFADLIISAGAEIELPVTRLAQLGRAAGIHLIVATQRPSTKVITGLIKANFSARLAFKVASKIDSQIILDKAGAEQLMGNGDMLFSHNAELNRLQGAIVETSAIKQVLNYIAEQSYQADQYYLPEYHAYL